MQHTLMTLPYEQTALEPYVSAETISFHYGKHHAGYVNKLNTLISGTEYENKTLDYIVHYASGSIFNNAAQIYNHDFYWHGLTASYQNPSVELSDLINRDFGSLEAFKEAFITIAIALFGSGWVWLVVTKENKLSIMQTSNADTPIRHGNIPLLTCDVWEHAYYIDYRNSRADYLENWWKLVNWEFVSNNLSKIENDPVTGYAQPCNDDSDVCGYVDVMQKDEHIPS
ncbi:MAG: superoxide dismutase [Sulfuricurvum sp.]|nr:superoxide dismutase [Sulfuricurvum sp.]